MGQAASNAGKFIGEHTFKPIGDAFNHGVLHEVSVHAIQPVSHVVGSAVNATGEQLMGGLDAVGDTFNHGLLHEVSVHVTQPLAKVTNPALERVSDVISYIPTHVTDPFVAGVVEGAGGDGAAVEDILNDTVRVDTLEDAALLAATAAGGPALSAVSRIGARGLRGLPKLTKGGKARAPVRSEEVPLPRAEPVPEGKIVDISKVPVATRLTGEAERAAAKAARKAAKRERRRRRREQHREEREKRRGARREGRRAAANLITQDLLLPYLLRDRGETDSDSEDSLPSIPEDPPVINPEVTYERGEVQYTGFDLERPRVNLLVPAALTALLVSNYFK